MPKSPGLDFITRNGTIGMCISRPTHTEDAIWDAVESAQAEQWTAERFRDEVAAAWRHGLEEQIKADEKTLT